MLHNVTQICSGYLATPFNSSHLRNFIYHDDLHDDHASGWPEYSLWQSDVYPPLLNTLADMGIPFIWEFVLTEDFSYFAYNFPTDDKPNNLVHYKTGKRKRAPHLTKKMKAELEIINAANTLLYELGIKNGSNNA